VWELKVATGDDERTERPAWAQRFAAHGAKGHHVSLTKDMSMSTMRMGGASASAPAAAPGGYDFAARPAVWEVCTSMEGDVYYFHIPSGHSQWDTPTSDNLSAVETPWNPAAAALVGSAAGSGGAGGAPVTRVGIGLALRCGYLDTGRLLKATLFLASVVAFEEDSASNYYFSLADGVLSQHDDESSYAKKQAPMDNVLMSAFTVLEAPEVLGTGPSAAKAVAPADASRAITLLLSADAKVPNPRTLYLRAPDNFARNEWVRAMILVSCCARASSSVKRERSPSTARSPALPPPYTGWR
jgi:hypothetical protein